MPWHDGVPFACSVTGNEAHDFVGHILKATIMQKAPSPKLQTLANAGDRRWNSGKCQGESLAFVQIHSGNDSNIIFLCICFCYQRKTMSKIFLVCYAAPSKLRRTAVSASATTKQFQNKLWSVSVSATKCRINSGIILICL